MEVKEAGHTKFNNSKYINFKDCWHTIFAIHWFWHKRLEYSGYTRLEKFRKNKIWRLWKNSGKTKFEDYGKIKFKDPKEKMIENCDGHIRCEMA